MTIRWLSAPALLLLAAGVSLAGRPAVHPELERLCGRLEGAVSIAEGADEARMYRDGGPVAGEPCMPTGCRVECPGGACNISCARGYRAQCYCLADASPLCTCSPCAS